MDDIIAARLDIIAAKAKILAQKYRGSQCWEGELSKGLCEIEYEIEQVKRSDTTSTRGKWYDL